MENINLFKEEKFDSFLTKTIIYSSKKYYTREMSKEFIELKIIDDENHESYLNEYLKCNDDYNNEHIDSFIDICDNTMLINALKSLSDIEMTVIFLMFEKQLTSSETSKILKIYSESVSRIKSRALKKLKKYLEDGDLHE